MRAVAAEESESEFAFGAFFGSLKSECLSRMIFFGDKSLRNAVRQYLEHYHTQRNHQSLENRIIEAGEEIGRCEGEIECCERLGGMLRYYYRDYRDAA